MASKKSLQLFKKLKKLSTRQRMEEANNPQYGRLMLSLLTPTQYAELFPKWYRAGLPDVSGFRAAITKRTQQEQQQYFDQIDRKLGTTGPVGGRYEDNRGAAGKSEMMKYAMDQLRKEGVPAANLKAAAAHLVGQAYMESGLNPNKKHDPDSQGNPTGYGIYGARYDRRDRMIAWLSQNGYANNSAEGQMRYMAHEAMTDRKYSVTRNVLLNASSETFDRDSDLITGNFERPLVNNYRGGAVKAAFSSFSGAEPPSEERRTGGSAPDFGKYAMHGGVDNFKGDCGIGARKIAGHMYGYSKFIENGLGGNAHTLSQGNNYFQNSGLFKSGRGIGAGFLTNDYLASLPIGTVISSTGGPRGQGHVQIKTGPNQWSSDTVQSHFLTRGYDNFVIHEPNEAGLAKLSENGVVQPSSPGEKLPSDPVVQPRKVSAEVSVAPEVISPNYNPDNQATEQRQDITQDATTPAKKREEAKQTATVGPRTFNINKESLISAIKQTDEFKNTFGSFAATEAMIYNGFMNDERTIKLMADTNSSIDPSTGKVTIGDFKKFQHLIGMDTSKILTEVPANTPSHKGGGREKIRGTATITKLGRKHRGDSSVVTDSTGKQFTVNPEDESMSVDKSGNVDIRPNREQMPMDKLLAVVRRQESGSFEGNYASDLADPMQHPRKKGRRVDTASGAYQYNNKTWKAVLSDELKMPDILEKYPRAVNAPKEIQDMVTQKRFEGWRKKGYTDEEIVLHHFTGNRQGKLDPKAQAGNPTPGQYKAAIASHKNEYDKQYAGRTEVAARQGPKLDTQVSYAPEQAPQAPTDYGEKFKQMAGLAVRSSARQQTTTPGSTDISRQPAPTVGPSRAAAESVGISQTPGISPVSRVDTRAIAPGSTTQMDLLREEMRSGFQTMTTGQQTPPQHVRANIPKISDIPDAEHQRMISTLPSTAKDPYGGVPSLERAANRANFGEDRFWAAGNKN